MYSEGMNTSTGWCPDMSDTSPSVHLTFVEQVYLLYAVGSTYNGHYGSFSIIYKNSTGGNVTYMNVDGKSVRSIATNYIVVS